MKFFSGLKNKYNDMSLVTKATLWFTLSNFINLGVSMLTTPIASRLLSKPEYGVISVYHTWEGIFSIIATLNLFCGIQEVCIAKNREDQNHVTASLMVLSLIIVVSFALIFIVFHKFVSALLKLDIKFIIIMIFDIGSNAIVKFWFTQKRFNYVYKAFVIVTILKSAL